MNVKSFLHRSAIGVDVSTTLRHAAEIMESSGIGCLAVIDDDRPVGIVTDRDIVRRALARGLPTDMRIDSVMSSPVVSVSADDDLSRAYEMFASHPVRRLAVTDGGRFAGIISLDDLLSYEIAHLNDIVRPMTAQALFAQRDAKPPVSA